MRTGRISTALGFAVVLVAAVGVIDAVIGRVWDLAAVLGALLVLGIVLVWVGFGSRRTVTLRADLAAGLADRSLRTGESHDSVTDRAVATYLDSLVDGPADTGSAATEGGA